MKRVILALTILTSMVLGCTDKAHLIDNKQTRDQVESRIAERQWLPERTGNITPIEGEALDFLYAYMPLGDAGDYDQELFLSNIRASLRAKQEMEWSKDIPSELFLHFVLPIRVNNEALDTSRSVFYDELKERVQGKTMYDAILEVNHWCHQKAVYTPSDSRTSSPSATVRSAYGRCGEESTFAVAALRSIGIPARQIYVPRWAHTDDNHAWVEAWADGKWYYLGACEPEPVLNKGWFDSPAKRSLLMFTKVFGDYNGEEEVISRADGYTEINVTENYAPVRTFTTTVTDIAGTPIQNAEVTFNIYNYAEQYPAVRKTTDAKGTITFTAGLGDITVWAKQNNTYGFGKIDLKTDSTITIALDKDPTTVLSYTADIAPPIELPVENKTTAEQQAQNDRRFALEDSIRGAYVATFISKTAAMELANKIGADTTVVWNLIKASRGNHAQIAEFLTNTPKEQIPSAMALLGVISSKDLRDTPQSVLRDHLDGAIKYKDTPYFIEHILNPRVDDELLTSYRAILASTPTDAPMPQHGFDSLNPARIPITPLGVHKLQMADRAAYERYAIALSRSRGIAARREPLTERPQYFDGEQWQYIVLPADMQTVTTVQPKGLMAVSLDTKSKTLTDNPKYYTHFSLARLNNGQFTTLDMSNAAVDMGEGDSFKALFNKPLTLETGTYQLTTGTRMADGTILMKGDIFRIAQDSITAIEMTLRQSVDKLQVIGNINPEAAYIPQGSATASTILGTTGRGYFILAMVDAKKEPTTHFMRALESLKGELDTWGRPIVLVFKDKAQMESYKPSEFPALPSTVSYGYDSGDATCEMLHNMMKLPESTQWPIVVVADSFGRVVYLSTGYNTSAAVQIKQTLGGL